MSKTIPEYYTVQRGDSLSSIGSKMGIAWQDIAKMNQLTTPWALRIGQSLRLKPDQRALSFQAQFLDLLRQPIAGLEIMLKADGKTYTGKTSPQGTCPPISTATVESMIEVFVKKADGAWKQLATTTSGLGFKLMTLVSPKLSFSLPMLPHDDKAAAKPMVPSCSPERPHNGKAKGKPIAPGHPLCSRPSKTNHNTHVLEIDFPQGLLELFSNYKDEPIAEDDFSLAAIRLDCDPRVLKAIQKQESKRAPFYEQAMPNGKKVPTLQFERHHFHRLTCANGPHANNSKHRYHGKGVRGCTSPHDADPDISWPVAFANNQDKQKKSTLGVPNTAMKDGAVTEADQRGNFKRAYLRLMKAYRLNPDAALQACSWGAFQIMGFNYAMAGYKTATEMVQAMCTSAKEQLGGLVGFINGQPALKKAVQDKNWEEIARLYNGSDWKNVNPQYADNLKAYYEEFSKKSS